MIKQWNGSKLLKTGNQGRTVSFEALSETFARNFMFVHRHTISAPRLG